MLKKLKQRAIQALCASIPNHGTGAVEVPVPSHEPGGYMNPLAALSFANPMQQPYLPSERVFGVESEPSV